MSGSQEQADFVLAFRRLDDRRYQTLVLESPGGDRPDGTLDPPSDGLETADARSELRKYIASITTGQAG